MSTKTLRKRIALSTVVALGAGVLSLVSTTAAHATVTYGGTYTSGSDLNPASYPGTLQIAGVASTTGAAVASATYGSNTSFGLVNVSDVAGSTAPVMGTTTTAVLLSTGAITVYASTSAVSGYDVISVTNGSISSAAGATYVNGTATLGSISGTAGTVVAYAVKPNAGATSMTINYYAGASANNSTAAGSLSSSIAVTVTSSSTAGVVSAANSGAWLNDGSTYALTADKDTTYTGSVNYKTGQFLVVRVLDAYGSAVTSTSNGLLQATATNGATVNLQPQHQAL